MYIVTPRSIKFRADAPVARERVRDGVRSPPAFDKSWKTGGKGVKCAGRARDKLARKRRRNKEIYKYIKKGDTIRYTPNTVQRPLLKEEALSKWHRTQVFRQRGNSDD